MRKINRLKKMMVILVSNILICTPIITPLAALAESEKIENKSVLNDSNKENIKTSKLSVEKQDNINEVEVADSAGQNVILATAYASDLPVAVSISGRKIPGHVNVSDTYPKEFENGRSGSYFNDTLVTTYTLQNDAKFTTIPNITLPQIDDSVSIVSYSVDGSTFSTEVPTTPEDIKAIRFTWPEGRDELIT